MFTFAWRDLELYKPGNLNMIQMQLFIMESCLPWRVADSFQSSISYTMQLRAHVIVSCLSYDKCFVK